MAVIKLPQLAWHGRSEAQYRLPDHWQIETCHMTGYDLPAMTPSTIRRALDNPIGTKPIRELARGKQQVVILFDDMILSLIFWKNWRKRGLPTKTSALFAPPAVTVR